MFSKRSPKQLGRTHSFTNFSLLPSRFFQSEPDFQPDKRPPCSYHGLVKTPTCTTLQAIQSMPQDVGDMIGKKILMNQIMSREGYELMTKKIMSWQCGAQDFEDWIAHRFQSRVSMPHIRRDLRPNHPNTRSSGLTEYVSYKIMSYGNKKPMVVWVPLWWVELWHKGRNNAVRYANTHQWSPTQQINWYHALFRNMPTLGQWIYISTIQNTWVKTCTGNTAEWIVRRCFPTCDNFYQQGEGTEDWKEKWKDFMSGFVYKGRQPVSFVAYRGGDDEVDKCYQGGTSHMGNIHPGGRSMTFCENIFFYKPW